MPPKKSPEQSPKTTSKKATVKDKIPAKSASKALSMDDLLKQQPFLPPRKGKIIDAKIVSLSKRSILFDVGWKSYAVLGNLESQQLTSYISYLNVGDVLPVRIVVEESKDGYPVVSMRSFFEEGKWKILEDKFEKEEEVEVMCGEYGKGGVFIEFMGIRGVIPKIQLTEEFLKNPNKLTGHKIKVKVLEVDKDKNRLVVSQKASALGISYKDLKEKFDAIEVGKNYSAKVIGFSDFGVFCEINKIEGLIHISEISWEKVTNPKKYLKVGEDVEVAVVEKNADNLKLNLSIKRLAKDPWENLEDRYPKDKEINAEVVRKEQYGYIVRLEPGIEGLIHISKVSPEDVIEVGKNVTVYIEKIDTKNRRISLIIARLEKPIAYR